MQDTIKDAVDVLKAKADEGVRKLNELDIDHDDFRKVLDNTLTCIAVVQKTNYDAKQGQKPQVKKPNINV